jgi:SRSO17 transposase
MGLEDEVDTEDRFCAYIEELCGVIGHADRAGPLRGYCTGLALPCERKSVEPMAAVTAPSRTAAQHQALLHFVSQSPWSDEAVLSKVYELVLPSMKRRGAMEGWIIDDTGFVKKGKHSVGVGRQYCGHVGKRENCQVAVSLSVANHHASLPIAYRLYLPEDWALDAVRRDKAHVPSDVAFKTKPEIALELIKKAHAAGQLHGVGLMDAAYGHDTALRLAIAGLDLSYVASIQGNVLVWVPGKKPVPRAPKRQRFGEVQLLSVEELARALPKTSWRNIRWREGTAEWLSSRFARIRVHVGHRHKIEGGPAEEWLLIEWPEDENEPIKYWLSNLPRSVSFCRLVDLAKLRWRIERDYQELKQEVGLGDFEGRSWRGFHHHATLCIAVYGFLISERETIPPSGHRSAPLFPAPALPENHKPRGASASNRTSLSELHPNHATTSAAGAGKNSSAMSLLRKTPKTKASAQCVVTQ